MPLDSEAQKQALPSTGPLCFQHCCHGHLDVCGTSLPVSRCTGWSGISVLGSWGRGGCSLVGEENSSRKEARPDAPSHLPTSRK